MLQNRPGARTVKALLKVGTASVSKRERCSTLCCWHPRVFAALAPPTKAEYLFQVFMFVWSVFRAVGFRMGLATSRIRWASAARALLQVGTGSAAEMSSGRVNFASGVALFAALHRGSEVRT